MPAGERRRAPDCAAVPSTGAGQRALLRGGKISTDLKDLFQRSYWILVDNTGSVYVEAAGRALADLRLWRNGTDLADIGPTLSTIEPQRGHPLLDARIEGTVTPGLYLATAYAGPSLPWTDGDTSQPLHVRAGPADVVLGGAIDAVIGPFGSARFQMPAPVALPAVSGFAAPAQTYIRLALPDPATARLRVSQAGALTLSASIAGNNREPVAGLSVTGKPGDPIQMEVGGSEGQTFSLRALSANNPGRFQGEGPHLIAVDVAGDGGDEIPASAVLVQFDKNNKATVLTSTAPQIGPGQAWHKKFNLRGATSILFEVTAAGPLVARSQGPGVTVSLEALLGSSVAPRADGQVSKTFDVEPGWYRLRLSPVDGAVGILDLIVGSADQNPDAAPSPSRTAIPLGIFDLDRTLRYQVFTDSAAGLATGLNARALPAELATPLAFVQNGAIAIPVRVPAKGKIAASDATGHPVAVVTSDEKADSDGRTLTLRIAAPDQPRRLVLSWSNGEAPPPVPPIPPDHLEALQTGTPRFFDLKQDQQREYRLILRDGGLYRIETLGRLKTSATVATAFVPELDTASDNGAGHNALLQTYLRAGSYRISVKASESAGHLAVVANPAPLPTAGPLAVDGGARATLAQGSGATFAFDIAEAGLYRLDLYGLGDAPSARLEDSEGWPLTVPGPVSRLQQRFAAATIGWWSFRKRLTPAWSRDCAASSIRQSRRATARIGWRSMPCRNSNGANRPQGAERVPDRWEFELKGEAHIALDVSDGMVADLIKTDETRPIAKLVYKRGFSGPLAAGRYAAEARVLARDDRLDYQLT